LVMAMIQRNDCRDVHDLRAEEMDVVAAGDGNRGGDHLGDELGGRPDLREVVDGTDCAKKRSRPEHAPEPLARRYEADDTGHHGGPDGDAAEQSRRLAMPTVGTRTSDDAPLTGERAYAADERET